MSDLKVSLWGTAWPYMVLNAMKQGQAGQLTGQAVDRVLYDWTVEGWGGGRTRSVDKL